MMQPNPILMIIWLVSAATWFTVALTVNPLGLVFGGLSLFIAAQYCDPRV